MIETVAQVAEAVAALEEDGVVSLVIQKDENTRTRFWFSRSERRYQVTVLHDLSQDRDVIMSTPSPFSGALKMDKGAPVNAIDPAYRGISSFQDLTFWINDNFL